MAKRKVEEKGNIKQMQRINTLLSIGTLICIHNDLCFFFKLFYKAVKTVVCMVVTVIFNALSTVRTCVTYNLENVLHVNLDGQENRVLQV